MEYKISNNEEEKRKMNFEIARALAMNKFSKLHPKETLPDWLSSCSTVSGTHDETKGWIIFLTVVPKEPLAPNYFWDEINGNRMLVRINPVTGEKGYVIFNTPREVITIFKAVVNPDTAEVTVLIDGNFIGLSKEKLECCDIASTLKTNYKSLWLEPTENLNFEQLKVIKDVFGLHDLNLIEIKKKYANRQKHLLCNHIHPTDVEKKIQKLFRVNIRFSIEEEIHEAKLY